MKELEKILKVEKGINLSETVLTILDNIAKLNGTKNLNLGGYETDYNYRGAGYFLMYDKEDNNLTIREHKEQESTYYISDCSIIKKYYITTSRAENLHYRIVKLLNNLKEESKKNIKYSVKLKRILNAF